MKTADWILEGYDSKADYEKAKGISTKKKKEGKTFNIRECPKCKSDDVGVVIGEVGTWQCRKCGHKGKDFIEKELTEIKEIADSTEDCLVKEIVDKATDAANKDVKKEDEIKEV